MGERVLGPMDEGLEEVKTLREPERSPAHCGKLMRKMQNASPATGKIVTVYVCDPCGHQQRYQDAS